MFKDWNFKALGLKNASFDENMMLIAFVNYFFAKIWKLCIIITVFGKKLKSEEKGREKLGREKLRS